MINYARRFMDFVQFAVEGATTGYIMTWGIPYLKDNTKAKLPMPNQTIRQARWLPPILEDVFNLR
jgi:hypothetical protein